MPQALLAKSVLVTNAVELLQSGPQMQDLWYISQPCCSVDVYAGLCVSAILDLYLPVYQAAASSLRMSSTPGPRASLWRCEPARCCSSVCICSQTYWQTKKENKRKATGASFLALFTLPCIHQLTLLTYEIWITCVYQRQDSMDLWTEF